MEPVSSAKHPAFRAACALHEAAVRQRERRFLLEGAQAVLKAFASRLTPLEVYCREDAPSALLEHARRAGVPLYTASRGLFAKLIGAGYEGACSAVAVLPMWPDLLDEVLTPVDGVLLMGERLQDPRNIGMLVRTADALGARALVLAGDCGDVYSRASVRSTTGSICSLPVVRVTQAEVLTASARQAGWRQVGSSSRNGSPPWNMNLKPPVCLWVGSEESGLTPETRDALDALVTIPMHGGAHSMNVAVAAGALLYEALRAAHVPEH